MGGYYPDNDVAESFLNSENYFTDSHTWFIKLADKRPPWKALFKIFTNLTWLCILACLILSWLCWYLSVNAVGEEKSFRELSLALINTIGVTVNVSVNERPLHHTSRVFFLFLTLYALNLTSIYSSRMIAVFTDPGLMHQIDSIEEVFEAKIPFGMLGILKAYLILTISIVL